MKRVISIVSMLALLMTVFAAIPMNSMAAGKGDFDNNGLINTADARDVLRYTIVGGTLTQKQLWWCDYDQDGVLTTADARETLKATLRGYGSVDYVNVSSYDCWGERSIAVLGDSISFGAGCSGEIANNSYVGIVKNAINAETGSTNYGFMSAYSHLWTNPPATDICGWPTMKGGPGVTGNDEGWSETDNGNRLMTFGLTAYKQYASLTYNLRSGYNYQYVCVYYHTGPSYGQFTVANNTDEGGFDKAEVGASSPKVYDCENTTEITKRTGFFRVSDFPNGISINVVSGDNQPVTITGLGFYNDISGNMVTVNRYCRGGAMLTKISDTVIDQAASSGTLIVGLGYNDALWGPLNGHSEAEFTNRINTLISAVNGKGTQLIVNDYLWSNYKAQAAYKNASAATRQEIDNRFVYCRNELKRLAKETGGIYINQEDYHGDAIRAQVDLSVCDGVHPTNAGHKLMAQPILEALDLR